MAYLRTLFLMTLVLVMAGNLLHAGDWPQWRGPQRDNIVQDEQFSLDAWQGDEPVKTWEVMVGTGLSTVSIADGSLYTMGYDGAKNHDTVYCLDPKTGKTKWTFSYPAKLHNTMHKGGPSSTPSIDNDRVYTISRDALMHCLNAADGSVIWKKDLRKEFGVTTPKWGFSGSPLIYNRFVIVDVGVLAALDKHTGRVIWQTENHGPAYASPIAFEHNNRQLVAAFPESGLVVHDIRNGEDVASRKWGTRYGVHAATPVVFDGGRIFISSGYGSGAAMYQLEGDSLKELWRTDTMANQMSGCVAKDGYLYGMNDTTKTLECISIEDGSAAWPARKDNPEAYGQRKFGNGAVTLVNDYLVAMSADGDLAIVLPDPKEFQIVKRTKVFNEIDCWVPPVVHDGLLYLRSSTGQMVCYDMRRK